MTTLRALVPLLCVLATAPGLVGWMAIPDRCAQTPGNLPFFYDLYTFRGDADRTAIVASYAVEAGELRNEREDGCVQYRLVVSLVLADTAVGSVSRTDDSVTVRFERRPRDEELVRAHLEVLAPPSASTLQRVIVSDVTTPGFGQLYHGPFTIPDYSGSRLMLSDVALGEPDAEEGWRRGDVTLALLPTGNLPEGQFDLYYEIYNLPEGHDYVTEISIRRVVEQGGQELPDPSMPEVRTRFTSTSTAGPDAVVPELRSIASPLPPGAYRLTITIVDEESGERATRSRPFRIGD